MKKEFIHMWPEYCDALFWNSDGVCCGGYDYVSLDDNITIDLSAIVGLKEWYYDWDNESIYDTSHWSEDDWRQWWLRGLIFASRIKKLLPSYVDFYYMWYAEDMWVEDPGKTCLGGLLAGDIPMPVPRQLYVMKHPDNWSGCAIYEDDIVGAGDGEFIHRDEGEDDIDLRSLPLYQQWYYNPSSIDPLLAAKEVKSILPEDITLLLEIDKKLILI